MNQKKGAPRRPGTPRTIDLSATEIARAEEQAAQDRAAAAPATADAEADVASARDDAAAETSAETQGTAEPTPEKVDETVAQAQGAATEAQSMETPAQPDETPGHAARVEKTEVRRGAGPLGLLTAAILGGVVSIGGLGALNASGAIDRIPGLKGLFAAAPPPAAEAGVGLAPLQERIAALEAAPASSGVDPGRVEALESRIGAVETQATQLAETLASAPAAGGSGVAATDPALVSRIEQIEATVSQLSANGAGGGTDSTVIAQLSGKVDAGLESVNAAVSQVETKIGEVENRVATLEQSVSQMAQTAKEEAQSGLGAAQMIAANALRSAAAEGRPFDDLIQSVEALTGPGPQLDALKAQAATGLATPASLAELFEPAADAILALDAPKPQGIVDGLLANARSLVKVQPQGPVAGDLPEAIVSQIRAALEAGDLASAYALWEKLPEPARAASAQWGEKLKARLDARAALDGVLQSLTPDAG